MIKMELILNKGTMFYILEIILNYCEVMLYEK